ncbi:MAG: low specificity L-threonine aldolase [Actinobacteria bacterium]|nr:low specificity L-threonine aldolase [Actinomycetota bacterium]MCB9411479.1 low specificity L-threonine aldolase [Actinomycetota bacterium]
MATSFASDNYAGVHPAVLEYLSRVNVGHQPAYGDDDVTATLRETIKDHFGAAAEIFCVFNGTGANVVAMQSMAKPWEAAICTTTAHVNVDEGGAPESVAGLKLWQVPTADGKLTPESIDTQAWGFGDVHRAQPGVVVVTQSTELGTLYTVDELAAVVDRAKHHGLRVLLDGARITNAAAALGVPFRALTTDLGIDALSFGATKNGALGAESVIALTPEVAAAVPYLRKTDMQLASKMRFISAQFLAMFADDLWLRNATHANSMAARLRAAIEPIPGVTLSRPTEVNAVFAVLPPDVTARLQQRFHFYTWDQATGEVRLMCSWDTTESDISQFATAIAEECAVP